jgi:hypothetical protein
LRRALCEQVDDATGQLDAAAARVAAHAGAAHAGAGYNVVLKMTRTPRFPENRGAGQTPAIGQLPQATAIVTGVVELSPEESGGRSPFSCVDSNE